LHAYSILLIGAWVLGSGIVAYVCDNLGRKLGKRRLSLWGLRPKHTAMVVTVLTGMGIALVSVGLVALASANARQALFQVISLSQEAQSLQQEQKDLTRRNEKLLRYTRSLDDKATRAEGRAQTTYAELLQTLAQRDRVRKQRDRVRNDLARARKRLSRLEQSRLHLLAQVRESQARLSSLTAQLTAYLQRLRNGQKQLAEAKKRLIAAKENLDQLNKGLASKTAALASKTAELASKNAALQRATEEAKEADSRYKEAEKKLVAAQNDVEDLENQIDLKRGQLDDLNISLKGTQDALNDVQRELSQATERNVTFQTTSVLFSTGQEIARRVVYQPGDEGEVGKELDKLLKSANDAVRSQGAPGLSLLPGGWISSTGEKSEQLEEKIRTVLSQRIASDRKDVLIRALIEANYTEANADSGDRVQVMLVVSPNRLEFQRGEVIASRKIDARLSEAKVLESLLDLLQNQVRGRALAAGLIPPPSGVVGEINWEMILQTVRQIRLHRRPMEVRVVALADAWTADPLLIRFELRD
jgi:uncharacterized protein (DUF3084 family)